MKKTPFCLGFLIFILTLNLGCKCNRQNQTKSVKASSEGRILIPEVFSMVFGNLNSKDTTAQWFTADTAVLSRFFGSVNYKDTFTTHPIGLEYIQTHQGQEAWITVYSEPGNHRCQQCAPLISLIRFRKDALDSSIYKLVDHQFTDCYGNFGKPAKVSINRWSDSMPGLDIWWDQSESEATRISHHVWLFNVKGRLKNAISSVPAYEKNNQNPGYEFSDSLLVGPSSNPYPMIIRKQSGSLPDGQGGLKQINHTENLHFNLQEYKPFKTK